MEVGGQQTCESTKTLFHYKIINARTPLTLVTRLRPNQLHSAHPTTPPETKTNGVMWCAYIDFHRNSLVEQRRIFQEMTLRPYPRTSMLAAVHLNSYEAYDVHAFWTNRHHLGDAKTWDIYPVIGRARMFLSITLVFTYWSSCFDQHVRPV